MLVAQRLPCLIGRFNFRLRAGHRAETARTQQPLDLINQRFTIDTYGLRNIRVDLVGIKHRFHTQVDTRVDRLSLPTQTYQLRVEALCIVILPLCLQLADRRTCLLVDFQRPDDALASERLEYTIPERFLAIDAVFMPVTKVNFFVEPARSSSSFDLESLILEIWTNGSIMPDEALSSSAEILENTFGLLKVTNIISGASQSIETPIQEEKSEHLETIFIEELELSVRAYNCLKRANVHTLSDLLQYSADDLLEFKNFGQKSADEVCENLKARFNLDLRQ